MGRRTQVSLKIFTDSEAQFDRVDIDIIHQSDTDPDLEPAFIDARGR